MKKNLFKFLTIFLIILIVGSNLSVVFAVSGGDITNTFSGNPNPTGANNVRKIIGIVLNAVKIICLGIAIIMSSIIAIKYMTSSPEGKADMKKTSLNYFIGAVIMFGASTIIEILQKMAEVFKE